ncbi:MAG TPA: hypothetical protein VG099_25000, partial [Gemmataceae bacterium]|nr:hypothetical protein [Gemmataceae bacterium]
MAVLQSETTVAPVDAVILIHGTFAFASSADECKLNPWWSPKSEFCGHLNTCLSGIAECWPESLCRVFPWSKPGPEVLARFYNRSTFTWSGANREADRREAGKRLLEGLRTLEADDKPSYHLVGHSYGGTAIWYALLEDERQHQSDPNGYAPLRKLRSWTMLGTPFPKYVPKPMTWLGGVTMAAFIFLVIMVVLLLCWLPAKGWLRFLAALSLGTWVWTVILIGVGVLLGWGRWAAWRWHGHGEKGGLEAAAWKRHGHSWLGLFAPTLDEAILGLKRAIGPYVPIPSLHLGLWGIPINWGLIPVSELPVNGYVRTLAQGGEGGSVLAAIETEPVPHVNARG